MENFYHKEEIYLNLCGSKRIFKNSHRIYNGISSLLYFRDENIFEAEEELDDMKLYKIIRKLVRS